MQACRNLTVILAVPLVQTLRKAVTQIGLRTEVKEVVESGFKTGHSTVADLSYNQVGKTFQVNVTVRTTQYFGAARIESVQDALRQRFGLDSQLLVDQILVAQGGLSLEQISRLKDFISGGVVKPAVKEEPFDLKAAQERVTGYLQKQVDEALQGTSIRCMGAVQVVLGASSPVGVNLRLAAPQPLEEQTVKLLAAQLSAKISSPVELHGGVELESSDYRLVLELVDLRSGLAWGDQGKLRELAAMLLKRPDLQLRAVLCTKAAAAEAVQDSRPWREVREMLSRSHLAASQCSLQAIPSPVATPVEGTPSQNASVVPKAKGASSAQSSGPVRCSFSVYQSF